MASNYFFGIAIDKLKTRIEEMEKSIRKTEVQGKEDYWQSDEETDLEPVDKKEDFFFEGAEKLLEIWFTTKNRHGNESDLRNIPRFTN